MLDVGDEPGTARRNPSQASRQGADPMGIAGLDEVPADV